MALPLAIVEQALNELSDEHEHQNQNGPTEAERRNAFGSAPAVNPRDLQQNEDWIQFPPRPADASTVQPLSGMIANMIWPDNDEKAYAHYWPWVKDAKAKKFWQEWNIDTIQADIKRSMATPVMPKPVPGRKGREATYQAHSFEPTNWMPNDPSHTPPQAPDVVAVEPFALVPDAINDARPSRIDFREWFGTPGHPSVTEGYCDGTLRKMYVTLYQKTTEFSERWFGGVDLNSEASIRPEDSPWQVRQFDQFIEYTRLVAHADKGHAEWRDILGHPRQRRWLMAGMLAQVMEKKIFNQLLFGADDGLKKILDKLDMDTLASEGHSRKIERAAKVQSHMGSNLLPFQFWDSVDDLAAKTMMIFVPLLKLLHIARYQNDEQTQAATGKKKDEWFRIEVFFQELHTLLALAGYFQVCMALTPAVFHFLSATPGARMDYALESQSDMQQYAKSKAAHDLSEQRWQMFADQKMEAYQNHVRMNRVPADYDSMGFPVTDQQRRVAEHHRTRGAKIKFAVFPALTVYRQENKGKGMPPYPLTNDDYGKMEGQRVVTVLPCMVVYYQGLVYPRPTDSDGEPLDMHLAARGLDSQNPIESLMWTWRFGYEPKGTLGYTMPDTGGPIRLIPGFWWLLTKILFWSITLSICVSLVAAFKIRFWNGEEGEADMHWYMQYVFNYIYMVMSLVSIPWAWVSMGVINITEAFIRWRNLSQDRPGDQLLRNQIIPFLDFWRNHTSQNTLYNRYWVNATEGESHQWLGHAVGFLRRVSASNYKQQIYAVWSYANGTAPLGPGGKEFWGTNPWGTTNPWVTNITNITSAWGTNITNITSAPAPV
ncbi:hypothetical protein F4778DRAFT_790927 [Xylariomycetidae sp. FL2044]|nr:hypothetical protein F4778DRAFT_790927 [Xylariomycetidae sp. FL2044]